MVKTNKQTNYNHNNNKNQQQQKLTGKSSLLTYSSIRWFPRCEACSPPGLLQPSPAQSPYSLSQDIWRLQGRDMWQRRHSPGDFGPRKVLWVAGLSLIINLYVKSRSRNRSPSSKCCPLVSCFRLSCLERPWEGRVRRARMAGEQDLAGFALAQIKGEHFASFLYPMCRVDSTLIKGCNGLFPISTHFFFCI